MMDGRTRMEDFDGGPRRSHALLFIDNDDDERRPPQERRQW